MKQQKFKQTEIGLIPEDWEVKRFDELFSITAGGDLKKEAFSEIKDDKHPFPIYSNSLTNKGLYGYSSEYTYNENCVTITARGSLGIANARDHKFNAIIRVLVLSPIQKLNCIFMSEYINNRFKFSIESTGVPQLTAPQISKYKIIYPQPEEQSAIAQVLSDADSLIESLDKLIQKKKNIKQGTMQELLTGKKRLPGFKGEWEIQKLGHIANFELGRNLFKSDLKEDGLYKCIHYGELFTQYKERIDQIKSRCNLNQNIVFSKENDILMPTSDVTPKSLATASCIKEKGVILGGGILIIRLPSDYDGVYFSYFISLNKNKILSLVKGSTVFHIYSSDLAKLEIPFPEPAEQSIIAKILSDMDKEIEMLERKKDKYQKIKIGMMQELLTGRIRLK